jgi:hypothetical protein
MERRDSPAQSLKRDASRYALALPVRCLKEQSIMRNILSLTSASMLVLGLAVSGPAFAQSTNPLGRNAATAHAGTRAVSRTEIQRTLYKAGVDDRRNLRGHLVWAQDSSGQSVAFLIGPQDMRAGSAAHFNKVKLRSDLTKAGFKNINFADNPEMVSGQTAADQILAFESQSGAQPASKNIDASKLTSELSNAGLKDSGRLNGKLLRAQGSGQLLFVLVGPRDFRNGTSLKFTDKQTDNFLRDGFIDASMYNTNIAIVQGRLNSMDVIAVAGANIGPASTSTKGSA